MNTERQLLPIFKKIQMATVYHFQPWLSPKATSFRGSLLWSTKMIGKLRKDNLIRPVTIYPYFGRLWRHNTFYSIKPDNMANSHIEHQSGLIDVLMAFLYLYKDFDVEIDYTPKMKAGDKVYRPDALVKMTDKDLKEYHFIIEFERTRNEEAIYKEKLSKNQRMPSFKELGLSEHTKILYIYAYERFNVFWRPIQYQEAEARSIIEIQEKKYFQLVKRAKGLPDHKYRFLPYHQFTRLNEVVWTTPKGNKVSLI